MLNKVCIMCGNLFNGYGSSNTCSLTCKDTRRKHKRLLAQRAWRKANRDRDRNNYRIWERKQLINNIQYKIISRLRIRLCKAIEIHQKGGSAVKDLGCSVNKLKIHLQLKFYRRHKNGEIMSWDNYGLHGWHIDHIKPLSSFDLSNPEELKKACHYSNLQPLWAEDNLKKSNKV